MPPLDVVKFGLKCMEKSIEDTIGWDKPPMLFALHTALVPLAELRERGMEVPEGMARAAALVATSVPLPEEFESYPVETLDVFGEFLCEESENAVRIGRGFARRGFAGLALVVEAYEDFREVCEDGTVTEIAGDKREARMMFALDCWGRFFHVRRMRDEDAVEVRHVPAHAPLEEQIGGSIGRALRDSVAGIARHCPAGTVDLLAVRNAVPDHGPIEGDAFMFAAGDETMRVRGPGDE
jgi:hypothetical protein